MRSAKIKATLGRWRLCSWSMLYVVNPASRIADDKLPDPAQNSINTALRSVILDDNSGQELPT